MQRFYERFRLMHFALAVTMLTSALPWGAFAEDEMKAENVSFRIAGQVVVIYFDINAPADQVYKVTLTMKRRFDPSFSYTPVDISGDVGPSVLPGNSRVITWKLLDEFPKGLPGEDCFFVLAVESGGPGGGGISPIVWIAGGVAVLGGLLVAVLAPSKNSGNGGGGVVPAFPNPPARP